MSDSYTALHSYMATALAKEMNAYVGLSNKLDEKSKLRDVRGNPPVIVNRDRDALHEMRIKITVLTAAYVEALANLYLSFKLSPDQFDAVDRMEIIEKWATLPSLFVEGYTFPRGEALFLDLKILVSHRNATLHAKPELFTGGERRHAGNLPTKFPKIHSYIKAWDTLPARIVGHIGEFDHSLEYQKFKVASALDEYDEQRAAHPFPKS